MDKRIEKVFELVENVKTNNNSKRFDETTKIAEEVEESIVARVQSGRKMVSAEAALRHARELAHKRQPGSKPTMSDIAQAHRNLTSGIKHESEEIDELSNDLLSRYKKKASDDSRAADAAGDVKKADKRFSGVVKATTKQFAKFEKKPVAEEVESIDESFAVKDSSGKTVDVKFSDLEEGLLSKIADKVMGAAPKEPKYKVGQTVSYVTWPEQPGWDDRGRGKGKITNYSNGHYTVNGKPINHFEIKKLHEKTLTPAELKKREEVAKALERDDPSIDIGKKMAIATNVAKRVAETELDESFAVKDSSGKIVDVKFSESEAKKRAEELTKKTGQKHSVKFERTAMVRTVKEDTDGKDTVTLEIPALIRALEWAREDAEDDAEIHKFVEKLINHEGTVDMNFFSEGVVPSAVRKIDKNGRPYPAHQVHIGTNGSRKMSPTE